MRRLLVLLLVVDALALYARGAIPCSVVTSQKCVVELYPGPTENGLELVVVQGEPVFASTGELLLTTVGVDATLNFVDWVRGATDPTTYFIDRQLIFRDGRDADEVRIDNAVQMQQSQLDAAVAALTLIGRPVEPFDDGAMVVSIVPGSPAEKAGLRDSDVIVSIDGASITDDDQAIAAVRNAGVGAVISLEVESGGREDGVYRTTTRTVEATLADSLRAPGQPTLGVTLMTRRSLPVDVIIDAGAVGGPSGGLTFALSIIDLLGDEDLTGGRVVAATGTIDRNGVVGAIGGIRQKVIGALRRGDKPPASVFLIPVRNFDEAKRAVVSEGIVLVPIETLADALAALRALAAGDEPEGAFALAPTG